VSTANPTITETRVLRLCEEAREQLSVNHGAQAFELVHQALRLWPDSPQGLSLYGICVAKMRGEYAHAIHVCRRATELAPEDAELRTNLGRVYRLMGDNDRAYSSFLAAWRCNRSHPAAAAELARMGVRHPPVLAFLPRSHWCNRGLGLLRHRVRQAFHAHRPVH
jgi:Flp pilus assembly protein TadD